MDETVISSDNPSKKSIRQLYHIMKYRLLHPRSRHFLHHVRERGLQAQKRFHLSFQHYVPPKPDLLVSLSSPYHLLQWPLQRERQTKLWKVDEWDVRHSCLWSWIVS